MKTADRTEEILRQLDDLADRLEQWADSINPTEPKDDDERP